eukprot:9379370-Lingulodinium_polyedra.AAC.1
MTDDDPPSDGTLLDPYPDGASVSSSSGAPEHNPGLTPRQRALLDGPTSFRVVGKLRSGSARVIPTRRVTRKAGFGPRQARQ